MGIKELSINMSLALRPKEEWGSAKISLAERKALTGLYKSLRGEIFGEKPNLDAHERELLKDAVKSSIIEDGWPALSNLGKNDLVETASSHACSVAGPLYETRGERATPDTVWSYTTKNQFDRYTEKILREAGKFGRNSQLKKDWNKPKQRDTKNSTAKVFIPLKDIPWLVRGVAKVERYWPAQLLRYLEAVRLGRATPAEIKKLNLDGIPPESLKIPWSNFDSEIVGSRNTIDMAAGIAVKTMSILQERGLSDEQVIAVITAGYSPNGPISENGYLPEIGKIWQKILERVDQDASLRKLSVPLKANINRRLAELKYPTSLFKVQ